MEPPCGLCYTIYNSHDNEEVSEIGARKKCRRGFEVKQREPFVPLF